MTYLELIKENYLKNKNISAEEMFRLLCVEYCRQGNKWYHHYDHMILAKNLSDLPDTKKEEKSEEKTISISKPSFINILNENLSNKK